MARQLASKLEESAKSYLKSGSPDMLVIDIKGYVDHVALHLAKESHRLFMMADMILQSKVEQVSKDLAQSEEVKLKELGRTRGHYEELVGDVESGLME